MVVRLFGRDCADKLPYVSKALPRIDHGGPPAGEAAQSDSRAFTTVIQDARGARLSGRSRPSQTAHLAWLVDAAATRSAFARMASRM